MRFYGFFCFNFFFSYFVSWLGMDFIYYVVVHMERVTKLSCTFNVFQLPSQCGVSFSLGHLIVLNYLRNTDTVYTLHICTQEIYAISASPEFTRVHCIARNRSCRICFFFHLVALFCIVATLWLPLYTHKTHFLMIQTNDTTQFSFHFDIQSMKEKKKKRPPTP